jgi:hypothetical protein
MRSVAVIVVGAMVRQVEGWHHQERREACQESERRGVLARPQQAQEA